MSSPDMSTRHAALDSFIGVIATGQSLGFDPDYQDVLGGYLSGHPLQSEQVTVGLIGLLQADVDLLLRSNAAPGTYTEDDSEHFAMAIGLVSSLDDERAIPARVGALPTGGMAGAGILKYGSRALPAVLAELDSPDSLMGARAVGMAITILRGQADAAARTQILGLIGAALNHKEFLVRGTALDHIGNLAREEPFWEGLQTFVPALQDMAQRDPFIVPGQTRYPLRDRAKVLLETLRKAQ